MTRRRILPIFIPHLGCPNECVFCDQRRISGSPLPVSGKNVTEALENVRRLGLRGLELAYYGGSFTAIPAVMQEELLTVTQPYLADGTIQSIRVSTRPDAVDESVCRLLRRYGVETIELGAQSMSDNVLKASGRGHSATDTENAARLIKNKGFKLILQMMTGLPGADRQADIETARKLAALRPDGVRVYPTVIIRGTALEAMWRAGQYKEHTVQDAVDVCAEILRLFDMENVPVIRVGLNPTQELSGGVAVGGAYHPALGELVRSEILYREARELLEGVPAGVSVTIGVAADCVSAMIGQHRSNIVRLQTEFGLVSLKVKSVPDAGKRILLLDPAWK